MIVKQIYSTKNKKQLMINLPEDFKGKDRILVVLDDSVDTKAKKNGADEKGPERSIVSRGYISYF